MGSNAIEHWTEIRLHGIDMRDTRIQNKLLNHIFICYKTHENRIRCINLRANTTEIIVIEIHILPTLVRMPLLENVRNNVTTTTTTTTHYI